MGDVCVCSLSDRIRIKREEGQRGAHWIGQRLDLFSELVSHSLANLLMAPVHICSCMRARGTSQILGGVVELFCTYTSLTRRTSIKEEYLMILFDRPEVTSTRI